MPSWTLFGLGQGKATTPWPLGGDPHDQDHGQTGFRGMPRYDPARCESGCTVCADVCLPEAITFNEIADGDTPRLNLDYGRCIACQLCVEACPSQALTTSSDWAFGVRDREDLQWAHALASDNARDLRNDIQRAFHRSLHIRHIDAGSCNGCESELQALNNPFYNLHRLGILFTPSPRFADLLLVTGTVTYAMRDVLERTYEAMPEPRWVMACGTCAVSGGAVGGTYASGNGLDGVLPADLYLPGCPPNPAAIIHALLVLVRRMPQRVHRGQVDG